MAVWAGESLNHQGRPPNGALNGVEEVCLLLMKLMCEIAAVIISNIKIGPIVLTPFLSHFGAFVDVP